MIECVLLRTVRTGQLFNTANETARARCMHLQASMVGAVRASRAPMLIALCIDLINGSKCHSRCDEAAMPPERAAVDQAGGGVPRCDA